MRAVLVLTVLCLFCAAPVFAADDAFLPPVENPKPPGAAGPVTANPSCFDVVNQAPYTVFGTVGTNDYTGMDGRTARHRENFRLQPKQQVNFCTTGPFFPGQKLEFVIRTLIPVFSCMTGIDKAIVIHGEKKPEGGTKTWADCD
jgi:hypothetical protein